MQPGKIFLTNNKGEISQPSNKTYKKSYKQLLEMTDLMFPPINNLEKPLQEEYNSCKYWN